MNLKKKNWKVLTSKSVGTGPSSYEKRIYRAAVSQRLRNTALVDVPAELRTMNIKIEVRMTYSYLLVLKQRL